MTKTADNIIVALDVSTKEDALRLVDELRGACAFFKVGLQLYTAGGPAIVREIRASGAKVFLDLKLHDIPNTVAAAVEAAGKLDVAMLTIHLSGGDAMIRAAMKARTANMSILGVTVLTSADGETLRSIGVRDDVTAQVARLAHLGVKEGVTGVVASPHEIAILRKAFGTRIKIVTPGIRRARSAHDDQKRVMTAREAIAAGADYLVVGRPITADANPRGALQKLIAELDS